MFLLVTESSLFQEHVLCAYEQALELDTRVALERQSRSELYGQILIAEYAKWRLQSPIGSRVEIAGTVSISDVYALPIGRMGHMEVAHLPHAHCVTTENTSSKNASSRVAW